MKAVLEGLRPSFRDRSASRGAASRQEAKAGAGAPLGFLRFLGFLGFLCCLVLGGSSELAGVDRVLVPLAFNSDARVASINKALAHVEEGRYREGIEILQPLLGEETARQPGAPPSAIVPAPAEFSRDPKKFRESLQSLLGIETASAGPVGRDVARAREEDPDQRKGEVIVPVFNPRQGVPGLGGRLIVRRSLSAEASSVSPGRRFVPVEVLAQAALYTLPPPALDVYRELHDGIARGLLECAGQDLGALERVARRYFLTRYGDDAAEVLGDRLFEEGKYRGAMAWWRKILDECPDTDIPRARLRAKLLEAAYILGDKRAYVLERERYLREGGPAEAVARLEKAPFPEPQELQDTGERSSRWGGELSPGRPPSVPGRKVEFSWDSYLWSRRGISGSLDRMRRPVGLYSMRQSFAQHYPFVPLLEGGAIYVSGVFNLYKIDGRPGVGSLLAEFKKPVPADLQRYLEMSESCLYSTTLWRKSLDGDGASASLPDQVLITHYVVDRVRADKYMGYDITVEIPIRALVAFDARTGAVLWKTAKEGSRLPGKAVGEDPDSALDGRRGAGSELDGRRGAGSELDGRRGAGSALDAGEWEGLEPDEDMSTFDWVRGAAGEPAVSPASQKDFSYTSVVLVKKGLAIAGGWVQRGYVNGALRALDLLTGAVVWETPVSSSGMESTMFGELAREPFAGMLLEENGLVYYLSQLGVLAAVELESGRLRWLTTYDTIEVEPAFGQTAIPRDLSWGGNPLLLLGHVLIFTPRDSEYLYAVDTGTGPAGEVNAGRILWRFPNTQRHNGVDADLRDLLGYWQGRLYFSGPAEIAALDLSSMDAWGRLVEGGRALDFPRKLTLPPRSRFSVVSAGALTTSGVVFCDYDRIRLASLDLSTVEDITGKPFRFSEAGLYPGRVQVGGRSLIITSRHLISAYVPVVEAVQAPPGASR